MKKHIGRKPSQPHLPLIDADGLIAKEPIAVLERKMVKRNNRAVTEVLIAWSNSYAEDATWESLFALQQKFPHFNP